MKKDKSQPQPEATPERSSETARASALRRRPRIELIDQAIEEILTPSWAWRMLTKG